MPIRTIDYLVSTNQIPFSRLGKRAVRFDSDRLDQWLLLSEAELYGSMALQNAFYHRLPDFLKEFENEKDPALQHMFSSLKRMFVDSDTESSYDFLKGAFASYWETLEGMVTKTEGRKTVQIMKSEVENYLVDLLRENKRLQGIIDSWNAE